MRLTCISRRFVQGVVVRGHSLGWAGTVRWTLTSLGKGGFRRRRTWKLSRSRDNITKNRVHLAPLKPSLGAIKGQRNEANGDSWATKGPEG